MTAKLPFAWCAAEGCERPRDTTIYCHSHYEYHRRTGRTPAGFLPTTDEERFSVKFDVLDDGCWVWSSPSRSGNGLYGTFGGQSAHRWAYLRFVGPIDDGLVLDHLCRVTLCVNPDHLEPVTQLENVQRGLVGNKTHCKRGHEFTPENTQITSQGGRACRACAKWYFHQRYLARREGRTFSAKRAS